MSRLIILFVVLTIWAVINIVSARKRSGSARNGNGGAVNNLGKKTPAGKKYSWTWMQAAGSMKLKFVRPEQANGYPAISGTVNGITVMVQCIPASGTAQERMMFCFQFPEPAGIGLELKTADDAAGTDPDRNGTELLAGLLGTRSAGSFSMQVSDPRTFSACMSSQCLDHIARLSLIYPKVVLSDSELQVCTAGINNDPQSLHDQLETLLNIADAFAGFAKRASDRKKMIIRVPQELIDAEKDLRPVSEKPAEPVRQAEPEPVKPITPEPVKQADPEPAAGKEDLLQDQSSFLHQLWQTGAASGRQKEIFAPYAGREVEWSGVLKMFFSYSTDFVFGDGGGIKAAVELEEFKPEGSFMPIRIKAAVAFPKTEQEKLEKARGKTIRFRGKLLKIEPIAREIYLSSGSITGVLS